MRVDSGLFLYLKVILVIQELLVSPAIQGLQGELVLLGLRLLSLAPPVTLALLAPQGILALLEFPVINT
jgi:hypothetical protein